MRSSLLLAALVAASGASAAPLAGALVGGLTCLLGQVLVNGKCVSTTTSTTTTPASTPTTSSSTSAAASSTSTTSAAAVGVPVQTPILTGTGFTQTYGGIIGGNATTIDNPSYITYLLASSVEQCLSLATTNVTNAQFVATYYDTNAAGPKGQSMTCSYFTRCLDTSYNTNYGGQNQAGLYQTTIVAAKGWCKN